MPGLVPGIRPSMCCPASGGPGCWRCPEQVRARPCPSESHLSHLIPPNPANHLSSVPVGRRNRTATRLKNAGQCHVREVSIHVHGAPDTSWPDMPGLVPGIRPSTCLPSVRWAWLLEMPGTSPGMTACRSGRSERPRTGPTTCKRTSETRPYGCGPKGASFNSTTSWVSTDGRTLPAKPMNASLAKSLAQ